MAKVTKQHKAVSPEVLNKAQKLHALAIRGVAGEKDNAQSMLNALLVKYGLSISDVVSGTMPGKEKVVLTFKNPATRPLDGFLDFDRLYKQVTHQYFVCNNISNYSYQDGYMVMFECHSARVEMVKIDLTEHVSQMAASLLNAALEYLQCNALLPERCKKLN